MRKEKLGKKGAAPKGFDAHFAAAFGSCLRNNVDFPLGVALLMADAATKAERRKRAAPSSKSKKG